MLFVVDNFFFRVYNGIVKPTSPSTKEENKMKKLICLLLAFVMLLALVGCDEPSKPSDPTGTQPPAGDPPKAELSRGTVSGSVYTNNYLGFTFNAPGTWVYSTDEEIARMINVGVEAVLGSAFKETLKDLPSIYDMMVVDVTTHSSVNIGYENLSKTYSSNITEEQYLAAVKAQFAAIPNMTVVFPDTYETVKLGQTDFLKAVCSVTTQGVTMTQVYYVHKVDGYMSFVIVTIPSGYTVAQIEAMFH